MAEISISQFKATCLKLLAEISRNKQPLTVTKNGAPLVIVYPAPQSKRRPGFGFAKNSIKIAGDIVESISPAQDWDSK